MKISSYLKEKSYSILLAILFSFIAYLFLYTTHAQHAVIILLLALFWMITIASLIIEYARRAPFYNSLNDTLEHLDQKYLITEMIDEPEFVDGKELYHCLALINKAMIDHINSYKYAQQDYMEYIEMWVHEIKTPIAAAHLILSNNPSTSSNSVEEELERIEDFVEQVLYYARSSHTEKDYLIKQISLLPIVSKEIKRHSKTFIYKKIKVELHDLDKLVYSDSKWLAFILHQVLANALSYTDEGGTISIYTKTLQNKIALYIQDSGTGIHPEDLKRVFEKGFTGKNGRSNEKSTGMGLYLCKQLCDKLYLDISIQSSPAGTCVCIIFPLSEMTTLK